MRQRSPPPRGCWTTRILDAVLDDDGRVGTQAAGGRVRCCAYGTMCNPVTPPHRGKEAHDNRSEQGLDLPLLRGGAERGQGGHGGLEHLRRVRRNRRTPWTGGK